MRYIFKQALTKTSPFLGPQLYLFTVRASGMDSLVVQTFSDELWKYQYTGGVLI